MVSLFFQSNRAALCKREIATDSSESTTRYYSIAGQRPAMRNNDGSINYLLGDHLGSVSTVVDASGQIVSQSRYLPFGELLWEDGASPTDYTYTGQRSLSDIGLMDYNARFYDPLLGRFTSPDSIVPEPGSVIGYNRYMYVNNNPMIYADPSGHRIEEGYTSGGGSGDRPACSPQFPCLFPNNGYHTIFIGGLHRRPSAFGVEYPMPNNIAQLGEDGYSDHSYGGRVYTSNLQSTESAKTKVDSLQAIIETTSSFLVNIQQWVINHKRNDILVYVNQKESNYSLSVDSITIENSTEKTLIVDAVQFIVNPPEKPEFCYENDDYSYVVYYSQISDVIPPFAIVYPYSTTDIPLRPNSVSMNPNNEFATGLDVRMSVYLSSMDDNYAEYPPIFYHFDW